MRSSKGSIEKIGKDHYRVFVEFPRDPVTGKRKRKTKTVRGSKKKAEETKIRLLMEAGDVEAIEEDMTLDVFWTGYYFPRVESECRPNTVAGYRYKYETFWREPLGSLLLREITPALVERELSAIEGQKKRLQAFKMLRQILNHAVRSNFLSLNPLNNMYVPKVERYHPEVLSADQVILLLEHFHGHPIEPAVLVAVGCGLRRSEIAALDWGDLKGGQVVVDDAITTVRGKPHRDLPKSETSRRLVTVPGFAMSRLDQIRRSNDSPLVTDTDGGRMNPDNITKAYIRHMKDAPEGLPYVSLKNLRHTSLTLTYESGVDLLTVSRRAGHSGTAITAHYYLRPSHAVDEAAADSLDRLISRENR